MKKLIVFLVSIICLIGLSGCTFQYKTYDKISYQQFIELKQQNESFPLVIGSSTCSACSYYQVTMETFIKKYNIHVYFIDLEELNEEETESLRIETSFDSTPTTIFYKDGQLTQYYNRLVGAGTLSDVKTIFKTNGYLK